MANDAEFDAVILKEYRLTVRTLLDVGSPEIINNPSPRHASIIIEEMIKHARVSFRAFAGQMNVEVWNPNVMSALKMAIQRGVNVRLIVERVCDPILINSMPEIVRGAVNRLMKNGEFDPQSYSHCAIGDGRSLRLEMDRVRKSAIFTANNPELASTAASIFDSLHVLSVPYAV